MFVRKPVTGTQQLKSRRCEKVQYEVPFTQCRSSMCSILCLYTPIRYSEFLPNLFNNICLIFAIAVLIPLNTKNDATTYKQWRGGEMFIRQLHERRFGGGEYTFWTRSPDLTSAPRPLPHPRPFSAEIC